MAGTTVEITEGLREEAAGIAEVETKDSMETVEEEAERSIQINLLIQTTLISTTRSMPFRRARKERRIPSSTLASAGEEAEEEEVAVVEGEP